MTEAIAWAAGVFEAKVYAYQGKRQRAHFRLTDTRPELLEAFAEIVGVGVIRRSRAATASTLETWRWECCSRADREYVVDLFGPYMLEATYARVTFAEGAA